MVINIKEKLGEKVHIEDAILLRDMVKSNLDKGVVLDFKGLGNIPSTFLNVLLEDLINESGRETIFNKINVKNLSNIHDFSRVVLGTSFVYQ